MKAKPTTPENPTGAAIRDLRQEFAHTHKRLADVEQRARLLTTFCIVLALIAVFGLIIGSGGLIKRTRDTRVRPLQESVGSLCEQTTALDARVAAIENRPGWQHDLDNLRAKIEELRSNRNSSDGRLDALARQVAMLESAEHVQEPTKEPTRPNEQDDTQLTTTHDSVSPDTKMDMQRLKLGTVGNPSRHRMPGGGYALIVDQIIDANNLIATWRHYTASEGVTVWVTGVNTTGIVDGSTPDLGVCKVVGTKSYLTTTGATRTVYLLEPYP